MKRDEIRAARAERASEFPNGQARMHAFPSKLRAKLIQRDGKDFYEFDGFATIYDKPYEMYDMFGTYKETMDSRSLTTSLQNNPDVAFLLNHRGVTMARTTNGTLELKNARRKEDGAMGLNVHAFLNAQRLDIRDMASAVNDELITEMSFAFMLNDGTWNDDFTEFRITDADINRGDVSAVNYGANPYTSIQARTAEFMEMANHVPTELARAAVMKLTNRDDFDLSDIADWEIVDETGEDDDEPETEDVSAEERSADKQEDTPKTGMSVDLLAMRYKALVGDD